MSLLVVRGVLSVSSQIAVGMFVRPVMSSDITQYRLNSALSVEVLTCQFLQQQNLQGLCEIHSTFQYSYVMKCIPVADMERLWLALLLPLRVTIQVTVTPWSVSDTGSRTSSSCWTDVASTSTCPSLYHSILSTTPESLEHVTTARSPTTNWSLVTVTPTIR